MKKLLKKLKDIVVSITFAEPEEYDSAKEGGYIEKKNLKPGEKGVKTSSKKQKSGLSKKSEKGGIL